MCTFSTKNKQEQFYFLFSKQGQSPSRVNTFFPSRCSLPAAHAPWIGGCQPIRSGSPLISKSASCCCCCPPKWMPMRAKSFTSNWVLLLLLLSANVVAVVLSLIPNSISKTSSATCQPSAPCLASNLRKWTGERTPARVWAFSRKMRNCLSNSN